MSAFPSVRKALPKFVMSLFKVEDTLILGAVLSSEEWRSEETVMKKGDSNQDFQEYNGLYRRESVKGVSHLSPNLLSSS